MRVFSFRLIWLALAAIISASPLAAQSSSQSYKKAAEGDEVVKSKLFPKKGKIELNGPNAGAILNQSYVDTYLLHGGLTYFSSETWGFGLEGMYAINSDNAARYCIERFYNDPKSEVTAQCDTEDVAEGSNLQGATRANYGPAYVPIREVKYAVAGTAIWNPVYGKQLFFLSATGYFDLYLTMGAGLLFSDFYPEQSILKNGNQSRGAFPPEGSGGPALGASVAEVDSWGEAGRPIPEQTTDFMIVTGVGQKYHFSKRFNFKVELRNYLLLGTPSGFDLFFTLWGGLGMRI